MADDESVPEKPKRVRKVDRPYKFDEEIARQIIVSTSIGAPLYAAASVAGVTMRTALNWLEWAKKRTAPPELKEFRRKYRKARHAASMMALAKLASSIQRGNTRDAKWYLARTMPETFGRKTKMELTGKDGSPLNPPPTVVLYLPDDGSGPPGGPEPEQRKVIDVPAEPQTIAEKADGEEAE